MDMDTPLVGKWSEESSEGRSGHCLLIIGETYYFISLIEQEAGEMWVQIISRNVDSLIQHDYRDICEQTFDKMRILTRYRSSVRRLAPLRSIPPMRNPLRSAFRKGLPHAADALKLSAHKRLPIFAQVASHLSTP